MKGTIKLENISKLPVDNLNIAVSSKDREGESSLLFSNSMGWKGKSSFYYTAMSMDGEGKSSFYKQQTVCVGRISHHFTIQ